MFSETEMNSYNEDYGDMNQLVFRLNLFRDSAYVMQQIRGFLYSLHEFLRQIIQLFNSVGTNSMVNLYVYPDIKLHELWSFYCNVSLRNFLSL